MNWYQLPLRTRLGVIAAVLMILAACSLYLWLSDPIHNRPIAGLIRYAPILLMLCLAWDDLKKIPRWCWFAAPVVCIIGMLKPALWFVIVPALVLWLFSRN